MSNEKKKKRLQSRARREKRRIKQIEFEVIILAKFLSYYIRLFLNSIDETCQKTNAKGNASANTWIESGNGT